MASPINRDFSLANLATLVIPLNRWGHGSYSVQINSGAALVEGTLDQINRGVSPNWDTLNEVDGTALTALADSVVALEQMPLEAIKITAAGTTTGRVMQSGHTDW